MIIFVHMLKTGGTTLRELVQPIFGERLLRDYDDIPMSNRPEHEMERQRRRVAVRQQGAPIDADIVYGHFIMDKYLGLRSDLQFGAMFRDPADRIVSHYYHYLRNKGGLRNEILPEGITLLEFAGLPRYADMYRYLLGEVAVAQLDYVGVTEEFDASVELFLKRFDLKFPDPEVRPPYQRLNRAGEYRDPAAHLEEQGLLEPVRHAQRVNYQIYRQVQERFASLCEEYGIDRRAFAGGPS